MQYNSNFRIQLWHLCVKIYFLKHIINTYSYRKSTYYMNAIIADTLAYAYIR
jgi:hypothetical protein